MSESGFIDWLVKTMLGWARWITDLMWNSINSTTRDGGVLGWFGAHWKIVALIMILAGIVVDWLVWMVRWRPYWLWFRKKQIIYAEEGEMTLAERQAVQGQETRQEKKPRKDIDVFAAKKKPTQADEFEDDPFAEDEPEIAPRAREGYHVMFGDEQKSKRHVMFEDDNFDDPFSEQENQ